MRRISKKGKITGAIANKDNVKNLYDNGARFFLCDPRPYMAEGFSKYQEFATEYKLMEIEKIGLNKDYEMVNMLLP